MSKQVPSPSLIARTERSAPESIRTGRNLLFIVGAPRSGTTWLQRLLATHPRIVTGQETRLFSYVGPLVQKWNVEQARELDAASASGRGGVGLGCYLSQEEYFSAVQQFLDCLLNGITRGISSDQLFLEKTPGHARCIPEIHAFLPESRFIHIIRDPRDVVASLLAASGDWGRSWAPREAGRAASEWVKHVRAARRAASTLPPGAYCEVRYEDLQVAPVETVARLASFAGVAWSRAEIEAAVESNSSEAMRNGGGTPIPLGGEFGKSAGPIVIDPPSFVRKARVGSWRGDLTLVQKLTVWRNTRDLMGSLGYTWSFTELLPYHSS